MSRGINMESIPVAPRRSTRDRKTFQPFGTTDPKGKQKQTEEDEDQDEGLDNDEEEEEDVEEDEEEEEEVEEEEDQVQSFNRPAKKQRTTKTNGVINGPIKSTPKTTKTADSMRKTLGKSNGKMNVDEGHDGISEDNGLFNALLSPNIALSQTIEEWIDHFQRTGEGEDGLREEKEGVKELVEFLFRCCGLSSEITVDEADDLDGVPDMLDNIHAAIAEDKQHSPAYPLISKTKTFKSFRSSLATFLDSFLSHLSITPLLYITTSEPPPPSGPSSPLIEILLAWLHPMTSSQYRAIRHTATFIALQIGSAICKVCQEVEREIGVMERQKEAEEKKTGKKSDKRIKEMEARLKVALGKKEKLLEYLKDIFDGVFVHRYRDSDHLIRADCLHHLGDFMDKYPDRFVAIKYVHYVDWALTDPDKDARSEAVRSLIPIYRKATHLTSIRVFTTRAISRLTEMATRDVDTSIRVNAVQVLSAMEKAKLLSDDDEDRREKLGWLVYDREAKIRKAVSGMVKSIWQDEVEELKTQAKNAQRSKKSLANGRGKKGKGRNAAAQDPELEKLDGDLVVDHEGDEEIRDQFIGLKALATVLTDFSQQISQTGKPANQNDIIVDGEDSAVRKTNELLASISAAASDSHKHAWVAVEALWNEISLLQGWEILVKFLSVDHTSGDTQQEVWALKEDEETFMIQALLAVLHKTEDPGKGKKKEDDSTESDITRTLIKALPRLFTKHQTDVVRTCYILRLVQMMKLDMYMELRLVSAYEEDLWDNVTRQFFKHSNPLLAEEAYKSIQSLMTATALKTANIAKLADFDEQLMASLRDITADQDIAFATFEEDELAALQASLLRIRTVLMSRDICGLLEDDAEGKQSKAWDIILALANRARMGFASEEKMTEEAIKVLGSSLLWRIMKSSTPEGQADEILSQVKLRRDELCMLLEEYAFARNNVKESVKRESLSNLVMLHIALKPRKANATGVPLIHESLFLEMQDALQYRIIGAVQAAMERRIDDLENAIEDDSVDSDVEEVSVAKKQRKNAVGQDEDEAIGLLGNDVSFQSFIMIFIAALRAGVMDVHHSAIFLSHFGHLGPAYDSCLRELPYVLQDEGIYNSNADTVQQVVGTALQDSFVSHLESDAYNSEPWQTIQLAKRLQPVFVVTGANFRIGRKLASNAVCDFHTSNIDWVLGKMANFMKAGESAKDKKTKERAKGKAGMCLTYFKVLSSLSLAISGRDALKIKNHLSAACQQHGIKPAKSKAWDPLTGYEKRLVQLASTDSGVKAASRKQAEEQAVDEDDGGEEEATSPTPRSALVHPPTNGKAAARPRPRLAKSVAAAAVMPSGNIVEEDEEAVVGPSQGRKRTAAETFAAEDEDDAAAELSLDDIAAPGSPGAPVAYEDQDVGIGSDVIGKAGVREARSPSVSRLRTRKRPKRG